MGRILKSKCIAVLKFRKLILLWSCWTSNDLAVFPSRYFAYHFVILCGSMNYILPRRYSKVSQRTFSTASYFFRNALFTILLLGWRQCSQFPIEEGLIRLPILGIVDSKVKELWYN